MFLPNSRYTKVGTVEATLAAGETVVALKLRRLIQTSGEVEPVKSGHRLDIIAQARIGDATLFWHVADANTALDSRTLVASVGATLVVPKA